MADNSVVEIPLKEVTDALLDQKWIYASTQPQHPHEYCLRKDWSASIPFEEVVIFIRRNGHEELFDGRSYTYLRVGDYQYWTMGSPLPETILINRAQIKSLDVEVEGPYGWPRFEADFPKLPVVSGVYLMTLEYPGGFLPYSVGITRRPMRNRFAEHRRKYVAGDYNILDVEAAKSGVRSVVWKGWGWTPQKRADFDARKSQIMSLAERQLFATRIFIMDLGLDGRLPKRMEGAVANHFYKSEDTLFDRGMFLAPRWKTETPITVTFHCGSVLHGLPLELEI